MRFGAKLFKAAHRKVGGAASFPVSMIQYVYASVTQGFHAGCHDMAGKQQGSSQDAPEEEQGGRGGVTVEVSGGEGAP